MFDSMIKSGLKCTLIYTEGVKRVNCWENPVQGRCNAMNEPTHEILICIPVYHR